MGVGWGRAVRCESIVLPLWAAGRWSWAARAALQHRRVGQVCWIEGARARAVRCDLLGNKQLA